MIFFIYKGTTYAFHRGIVKAIDGGEVPPLDQLNPERGASERPQWFWDEWRGVEGEGLVAG